MHAVFIVQLTPCLNGAYNRCDTLVYQPIEDYKRDLLLSEAVLSHIQINLALVLLINLFLYLVVKAWDSLQAVFTCVNYNACLCFLLIGKDYFLLLRSELIWQMALKQSRVVSENVFKGYMEVEESLASAKANAPL